MGFMILVLLLTSVLIGLVYDNNKITSAIVAFFFYIIVCFSYDQYDYLIYTKMYNNVAAGNTVKYEILYVWLMKVFSGVGFDYNQFRMIMVAVEILLIESTVRKFAKNDGFFWSAFLIYPGWVLSTLMRHSISFSIVIFGTRYLIIKDNKPNKILNILSYCACTVIAALIHSSYWVMLVNVLILVLKPKTILRASILVTTILAVLTIGFGSHSWVMFLLSKLPIRQALITKYFLTNQNINGLIYSSIKQAIQIGFGLFAVSIYRQHKPQNRRDGLKDYFMNKVEPLNYCSIFVLCTSLFSSQSTRLNQVFITLNLIAWTIMLSELGNHGAFVLKKQKMKYQMVATGVVLLFGILQCTVESSVLFDRVLKMIFETNTILNL